ncbi:MAG: hypothetical protein BGO63_14250 [Candidatus Accumulibacter sp. 66-26]|nr:MAG: hypothetical protein BGO63_14250 [Candidatus Accumulibacter sp. 66-26]
MDALLGILVALCVCVGASANIGGRSLLVGCAGDAMRIHGESGIDRASFGHIIAVMQRLD